MSSRILIVDDEPAVRGAMRRALDHMYEVVLVASAEEALDKLEAERFDAVLSDTNLGEGRWGPQFLAIVAQRWPEMGRVIMSGDDQGVAAAALERGAAHVFLAKPWSMGEPAQAIQQAMDKAAEARSA